MDEHTVQTWDEAVIVNKLEQSRTIVRKSHSSSDTWVRVSKYYIPARHSMHARTETMT